METNEVMESEALRQKITNDASGIVSEIRTEIGTLEAEYLQARTEQKWGFFLLAIVFFSFQFVGFFPFVWIPVVILLYVVFKISKSLLKNLKVIRKFNVAVNKIIFQKTLALLGLQGQVIKDGEEKLSSVEELAKFNIHTSGITTSTPDTFSALDILEKSELITEAHNTNQVDNILEIKYRDSILRIAELDIRHVTGSGKNRSTKYIFHGYFASFILRKTLEGKTFVSTEGDENGFGHTSLFGVGTQREVKETILEWNEFENLLHVATTDEVEARYILTPNFMQDVYTWWKGKETNIRLSFIKNNLYILYPDPNIRLNQTIKNLTDESIVEYIHTIAWPLQNITKLLDDVAL